MKKSHGWGEKYLKGVYNNICADTDRNLISTDRNGIITHFLIGNFPNIFTDDILERDFGHGSPENTTVPAEMFSPHYDK